MDPTEPDSLSIKINAAQIRAARAILGWSQTEAAEKFGLARASLAPIERGESIPRRSNIDRIIEVLAAHGISLVADEKGFSVSASVAALNELD